MLISLIYASILCIELQRDHILLSCVPENYRVEYLNTFSKDFISKSIVIQ